MCRLKRVLAFLALCSGNPAFAQLFWIPDISFQHSRAASVYAITNSDRPLILAVGNIHTPASERLFESGLLQDLNRRHHLPSGKARFSTDDLEVAFLNVRVFADEAPIPAHEGIPVMNIDESDTLLNTPGWRQMYCISSTGLFLITPDHLVHPLSIGTEEDVYAEARRFSSKLHPGAAPDARLVEVITADHSLEISVQNFSTAPLNQLEVSLFKNGHQIMSAQYTMSLASLRAVAIHVPVDEEDLRGLVTVIVKTAGDSNPTNNQWSGILHSGSTDMIAAGDASR